MAQKHRLYKMITEDAGQEIYEQYDNIMFCHNVLFIYSPKKVKGATLIDPKKYQLPQKVKEWAVACDLVAAKSESKNRKNKLAVKQLENDFIAELDKALIEITNKSVDINEYSTLKDKGFTIERG
ncbi:MAG: hypothetical protein AB9836_04530 [Aminipila sp.]